MRENDMRQIVESKNCDFYLGLVKRF